MPGTIRGTLFDDANGDGVFTGTEKPTGSRLVELFEVVGGVQSVNPIRSVNSDAAGNYVFDNLPNGIYRVARDAYPFGYTCSTDGGNGYQEVVIAADVTINVGSKATTTTPPVDPDPPSAIYPLRGIVGGGAFPSDKRKEIVAKLGVQGTREWLNHSDRFTKPPTASELSGVLGTIDWYLDNVPNSVCVITIAREGKVENGKLTRTQARPAKYSNMVSWAKAYWDLVKQFGNRVIHQIGNEIEHTKQLGNGYGAVYFQADPQPSGSNLPWSEWTMKSYIETIQKPFYDTLKSLGGGNAVVGGFSVTWNAQNMKTACEKYSYAKYCDVGDIHRYARSMDDWVKTASVAKKALGGKPLLMSEWGAAHNENGYPPANQASLMLKGYPLLAGVADFTFYYMAPAKDGKVNDPGLWNDGPVEPIYSAFGQLPKR